MKKAKKVLAIVGAVLIATIPGGIPLVAGLLFIKKKRKKSNEV